MTYSCEITFDHMKSAITNLTEDNVNSLIEDFQQGKHFTMTFGNGKISVWDLSKANTILFTLENS